jgi:hypothetical protein
MIYAHANFLEAHQDFFMNRTPSPPPVSREDSGNQARLPLFLPSPPEPTRRDFGIRTLAGLPPRPPSSAAPKQEPASPPVPQKESFGIRSGAVMPPPSAPVPKSDFGIRSRMSPSTPVQKNDFEIRSALPPSPPPPVLKNDFGIRSRMPPVTPVQKSDFGIRSRLPRSPPLPVPKQNYGLRAAVFETQATQEASSSLSLHAEDFGVSVPERPSQIGNLQPTEEGEPLGSSSKPRSEFHMLTFMRFLLIYMQPGDGENQHHLP